MSKETLKDAIRYGVVTLAPIVFCAGMLALWIMT